MFVRMRYPFGNEHGIYPAGYTREVSESAGRRLIATEQADLVEAVIIEDDPVDECEAPVETATIKPSETATLAPVETATVELVETAVAVGPIPAASGEPGVGVVEKKPKKSKK